MSEHIRPSRAEAEEAVRTLIRWAGDDPARPGMQDTPERLLGFYDAFFKGYHRSAADYDSPVANDMDYEDFILIRDIRLLSFCEHHMLPATGTAHIAYIPGEKLVGIGTVARLASEAARRFTTQEALTAHISALIKEAFAPKGHAIALRLSHGCMTLRDTQQENCNIVTTGFSGIFTEDNAIKEQFLTLTMPHIQEKEQS